MIHRGHERQRKHAAEPRARDTDPQQRRGVGQRDQAEHVSQLRGQRKQRLRAYVHGEEKALRAGAIGESVRLAGQFHVLLTELAGGTGLLGLVGQLVAKTELYKALFDPSKGSSCSADEHARIIDALDADNLQAAVTAMREHLSELEERVVEQVRKSAGGEDWGAVFGV